MYLTRSTWSINDTLFMHPQSLEKSVHQVTSDQHVSIAKTFVEVANFEII